MANFQKLFLDTGFVQAVYYPRDEHYQLCYEHFEYLEKAQEVYTTDLVLMEVLDAFSKKRKRKKGFQVVETLIAQPHINIIHFNESYFQKSLELYGKMTDKDWGATDCFSILVMREHNLTTCLTTDRHFQQAGFDILPFQAD